MKEHELFISVQAATDIWRDRARLNDPLPADPFLKVAHVGAKVAAFVAAMFAVKAMRDLGML